MRPVFSRKLFSLSREIVKFSLRSNRYNGYIYSNGPVNNHFASDNYYNYPNKYNFFEKILKPEPKKATVIFEALKFT